MNNLKKNKISLFPGYFVLTVTQEGAALALAEMLAKASTLIEPKHRKAFGLIGRDFCKAQDKNPWRKKDK